MRPAAALPLFSPLFAESTLAVLDAVRSNRASEESNCSHDKGAFAGSVAQGWTPMKRTFGVCWDCLLRVSE